MSEKTEWVTVKVPKEKRATATDYKPDDVTWGDCLVAGAEHLTEHLASDPEHYREDTAREVLDVVRDELGLEGDVDMPEYLMQRMEPEMGNQGTLRSSVETIEERTGRIERMLEDLQR